MGNNTDAIPCKTGMLAFQALPSGGLVDVIEEATECPISHVGILHSKEGQCLMREAFGSGVQVI